MPARTIDLDVLRSHTSYTPSHILGGLYQGADPPIGPWLRAAGVDALVLAASECQHDAALFPGVQVVHAPGHDDDTGTMDRGQFAQWNEVARWVADQVARGRVVLVCCHMGWNRSGFVTAMAVRYLTRWDGGRAAEYVKFKRPVALRNRTFVAFLRAMPAPMG